MAFHLPISEIFSRIDGHINGATDTATATTWQGHRSALEAFQRGEVKECRLPSAITCMGWVMPSWGYGRG